jgi:hypothetical protein
MRISHVWVILVIAASVFALSPPAQAQIEPAQPQQVPETQAAPQQPDNTDSMPAHEVKAFSGQIVQKSGKFMLRDSGTKMSYQLDDQEKAKDYKGQQVRVTGTLDSDGGKLIHVQNIEAAGGQ